MASCSGRKYRVKQNHTSPTQQAKIRSLLGDVVQGLHEEDGHDGPLIFYIDANGERFCCPAAILEEVPAETPLKKQFVPLKYR